MTPPRQRDTTDAFRPLYNPATGETYQFIDRPSPLEPFRMRWSIAPGGRIPEHMHPKATERFVIESGQIRVWLDDVPSVFGPGEIAEIPPGVRHRTQHEAGDVRGYVELEPALRMPEFFEMVSGLSREGLSTKDGVPRNPFQAIAFLAGFWGDFRATELIPPAVQRYLLPLAGIARLFGYRDHYERYDAATGTV